MQLGAPAHQRCRVGLVPEPGHQGPHEQALHQRHARVGRHLEPAQLHQAQAATVRLGGEQLVDAELGPVGVAGEVGEQVAEQAVHQPRWGLASEPFQLAERDLQLVEGVVAGLVHPGGLAGGADEAAREQVRQRRVVLPVGDQAAQQVGSAQQRAVGRRGPAEGDVVAAPGTGVGAVQLELLGAQPALGGGGVEHLGGVDQLPPRPGRVQVDLDDPRVRGHHQDLLARVARRRVALDDELVAGRHRHRLDHRQQFHGVLEVGERRQEHGEAAVAQLHPQRGGRGRLHRHHRGRGAARGRLHPAHRTAVGQRRPLVEGGPVGFERRRRPGEGVQRQAHADGRVARDQVQPTASQPPAAGGPAAARTAVAVQRHDPAHRVAGVEAVGVGHGVHGVVALGRVAGREPGGGEQRGERVFVGGEHHVVGQPQGPGQGAGHGLGVGVGGVTGRERVGQQLAVGPQRLPVGSPVDPELPAGQRLARVPLALAGQQQGAGGEAVGQPVGERPRPGPLVVAVGRGVPLGALHVVDRHEGGFAAVGEPDVALGQPVVDGVAQGVDAAPLVVGVGKGDPGVLVDAVDLVAVGEGHLALVDHARDGGRGDGVGGARQRDVALAGEQPAGGIEADPPGPGHVHLAPRVQVGEVALGAGGTVERPDVGGQLHQVARHEPGGQAQVAQDLHQQPPGVPAGPEGQAQGLLRGLDPWLEAGGVGDVALEALVHRHQEVHDAHAVGRHLHAGEPRLQVGAGLVHLEVRREVAALVGAVGEREPLGVGLHEEVERVDHGEVGHQVHGDAQLGGLAGEHQPGQEVPERVLLPVHEVVGRFHCERVREHRGPAVGRGPQPHHVRADPDRAVERVVGAVLEGDVDAHAVTGPGGRPP